MAKGANYMVVESNLNNPFNRNTIYISLIFPKIACINPLKSWSLIDKVLLET